MCVKLTFDRGAHFEGGTASDGHRRGGPDGLDAAGGAARRRAVGGGRHPDGLRRGRRAGAGDAAPVGPVERPPGDRQRPRARAAADRPVGRDPPVYVQRQGGHRRRREGRRQGLPRQRYIGCSFVRSQLLIGLSRRFSENVKPTNALVNCS